MKLEIELRSDLCVAVGKGFAATIDTDTAVDEYGLPYIPARRLKGCLKDVAKEYMGDSDDFKKIFGEPAKSKAGVLTISDARLENYESLVAQFERENLGANQITELFCSVRGETSIETESGSAKENSLRYTRVVEHLSPFDNKPLKFIADISCPGFYDPANEHEKSVLGTMVGRLCNIGYHRNRGLGWVKCRLTCSNSGNFNLDFGAIHDDSTEYVLTYTVKLKGDLMLPGNDANHSLDYIPGVMALGALAGKFISEGNTDDQTFNRLFYSKDVRFGNLYPSDEKGNTAFPAPAFLGVIKGAFEKSDKTVKNLIKKDWNDKQPEGKSAKIQYKPFKKDYIAVHPEKSVAKVKAKTKIVYHNAISGDNAAGLYTQNCLSSGQFYSGFIRASGEKMRVIAGLFEDGIIRFGRSKTAQYSLCEVINTQINEYHSDLTELRKGNIAAFVLRSDAVLVNELGVFSTELSELIRQINKECNNICPVDTQGGLLKETAIRARTVSGYNSKWNLKKPQFPAIKAGSCVIFKVPSDITLNRFFNIGEKLNEGYGVIELLPRADEIEEKYIPNDNKADQKNNAATGDLSFAINREKLKEKIVEAAIIKGGTIGLNASQTGRVSLMCKESRKISDFIERINSIKSDETREKAEKAFNEQKLKDEMSALGVSENDNDFWKLCYLYILTALNIRKYQLRMKGETD